MYKDSTKNKLLLEQIKENLKEESPNYLQAKLKNDYFSLYYHYKKKQTITLSKKYLNNWSS